MQLVENYSIIWVNCDEQANTSNKLVLFHQNVAALDSRSSQIQDFLLYVSQQVTCMSDY